MLHVHRRRRRHFRNRIVTILAILGIFVIVVLLLRSKSIIEGEFIENKDDNPRLFCVLIHTHSSHERFIHLGSLTWAKHCHRVGIARFRKVQGSDDDFDLPQLSYYVNLWTRILDAIRNSIDSNEYISNNDLLVIVPAPTYVFQEKLTLLFNTSSNDSHLPAIIVHEQQEANAYLLNGQALDLVRNTQLMDSCLQHLHPTARERHLWKCVKDALHHKYPKTSCDDGNCFIQYHEDQVTLAHIKNGYCSGGYLRMCRSIALLYPTTVSDFITLEFFKYRLKSKPSHDLL